MPRASLSILLYLHSAPVKPLLAIAMGCRIKLSGTMSVWYVFPSPSQVGSSVGTSPTPEAPVSK